MENLRHLSDLRPAALELQAQAAPEGYRIRRYKTSGRQRSQEHNGNPAVIHDLYMIDHRLAWKPAGDATLHAQRELRQFSAQLMAVQEKERKRIAADLHDGIGQSLSLIKMSMESVMQLMVAGRNQQAMESMQRMVYRLKDAMAELRRTTADLHPPMLDDLGIIPTVTWFLREFEAACPGKTIEVDIGLPESEVPAALKATIFRILQEAMNNIAKHAKAPHIRVILNKVGTDIHFVIEDNGQGFDPERRTGSRRGTGFGLVSMKERAMSSHGTFEIKSAPGQGTHILITWPSKDFGAGASPVADTPRGRK